MSHVLVLTTEPLPFKGMPTTGAGLRAWGLARGLESHGHDVIIAMSRENVEGFRIEDPSYSERKNTFQRNALSDFVRRIHPDVILFQHWGLMKHLDDAPCPVALDLAGPHLLERYYWSGIDKNVGDVLSDKFNNDISEKLQGLRKADFVICSGKRQRRYFLPFLTMAGHPVDKNSLPVVPFSMSPDTLVDPPDGRDPELFVYGGMFLPWQNPRKPLQWLLECFDECNKGRLLFFGGMHPTLDVSEGRFNELLTMLEKHPRVEMRGIVPFEDLCREYIKAGAALDLMERNPERELAFTTRTVAYLWCGLPVIYNDYSELSEYIQESGAGWTLDPENESQFKEIVRAILEDREDLDQRRRAARGLFKERLNWNKTIVPLSEFCHNPFVRPDKQAVLLAAENKTLQIRELQKELEVTKQELLTLKGKLWYRLYKRSNLLKILFAPALFTILLPISLVMLISTLLGDLLSTRKR